MTQGKERLLKTYAGAELLFGEDKFDKVARGTGGPTTGFLDSQWGPNLLRLMRSQSSTDGFLDDTARPVRMLVVDDNADAADSLAEVVRSMGHHAEVSYSGLTALQIAADGRFDLVMLDIGLPEIDGYEVARRLRRILGPSTRIVAVTGYGAEEDRRRSREAGFDDHVVKPMMPETLSRILAALQPELLVFRAHEKFDAEGRLTDAATAEYLQRYLTAFADWVRLFAVPGVGS
jgi:CheY-like chemotaxis protein